MGDLLSGPYAVVVFVAIVLVLSIVGTYLKRKASRAGQQAGQRFAQRTGEKLQATLATSVLLGLEPAAAAELVQEATASMRLVTRTGQATWDLEAIEKGDLTFAVVPVSGGSAVVVERYREQLGSPAGAPYWKDVVKKTTALAEQRGVQVGSCTAQHVRGNAADAKNWWWVRVGA